MCLCPWSQIRHYGVLLLTPLLALPRAEHTVADNRILRVHDGVVKREYRVPEPITAIGLTELRVAQDRPSSLSSLLTTVQLRDYIRHDESRFPQSKMPQFSKLLQPTEIKQVAANLQAIQPTR